jgi:hypothetical protein
VKKFCFVVGFFIWIIIINYWCDIKSEEKLECFGFDFFGRSEKKNREGDESVAKHTQLKCMNIFKIL